MPHDWRDSLRLAADLALLGVVVTLLSLPLLTAGAAVATGSHAIRHLITHGRWPSLADCWAVFRRRLVPGLIAGPAVALGTALVLVDVAALRRGAVPGGGPMLTLVLAVGALAAGYVALLAVEAGTLPPGAGEAGADRLREGRAGEGGSGTRRPGAARSAFALAWARPVVPLTAAGVLAVVAVLALLVHPALVPVLAGYALFALHVVTPKVAGPGLTRAA